jgi:hypothetical protein
MEDLRMENGSSVSFFPSDGIKLQGANAFFECLCCGTVFSLPRKACPGCEKAGCKHAELINISYNDFLNKGGDTHGTESTKTRITGIESSY